MMGMTIDQAVYYQYMLELGLTGGFDDWLDERLGMAAADGGFFFLGIG